MKIPNSFTIIRLEREGRQQAWQADVSTDVSSFCTATRDMTVVVSLWQQQSWFCHWHSCFCSARLNNWHHWLGIVILWHCMLWHVALPWYIVQPIFLPKCCPEGLIMAWKYAMWYLTWFRHDLALPWRNFDMTCLAIRSIKNIGQNLSTLYFETYWSFKRTECVQYPISISVCAPKHEHYHLFEL